MIASESKSGINMYFENDDTLLHLDGLIKFKTTKLDWCFPCSERTPAQHPYAFDAHYIWRNDDIEKASGEYSDRMWQGDNDKMKLAMSTRKSSNETRRINKKDCQKIVKTYFGKEYECVAYALCCNVSNGNPIGIFFIRKKIVKTK